MEGFEPSTFKPANLQTHPQTAGTCCVKQWHEPSPQTTCQKYNGDDARLLVAPEGEWDKEVERDQPRHPDSGVVRTLQDSCHQFDESGDEVAHSVLGEVYKRELPDVARATPGTVNTNTKLVRSSQLRKNPVNPRVLPLWSHAASVLEMFYGFAGLANGCQSFAEAVVDVP